MKAAAPCRVSPSPRRRPTPGSAAVVVSDETGAYILPSLPVGPYQLEFVLSGFRTFVQTGIVLQVNTNPTVNATLPVGDLSETISVEAQTPLIETRSSGIGMVVENERVLELPLNGRQTLDLIYLTGMAAPSGTLERRSRRSGRRRIAGNDRGRRRPAERHGLRARRQHTQRSLQQRGDAVPVSGGAAGVQGRDQRAARAVRLPLGGGRQRGHQVGHQHASPARCSSSSATTR